MDQSGHNLATCAHSELGFIRVSMQVFGYTLDEAHTALDSFRPGLGDFVAEAPAPRLPAWASIASKTSDGYLTQVAAAHNLCVATFDAAMVDAELIRR